MESENFKASAQYDDWKGTAAADDADQDDFSGYLRGIGKLTQNEVVVGISFYSAPNFTHVNAFISDDADRIRRITVPMSVEDFFKKFKRFSVYISRNGRFDGEEIEFENGDDE
jgi:hypothetical protein